MTWAFDTPCPTPSAKLVLLKLADHANDEGECWPSQGHIASDCGLTRQTVNEQIRKLVDLGLIKRENRFNGTGQQTNRYFLQCRDNRHPLSDLPTGVSAQATPPVGSADTEPSEEPTEEDTKAVALVLAPAREPARKEHANGKRTRIAADWWPDSRDARYAEEQGHDAGWIEREAESFRDRCLRDEPTYADWHAAWRTWVRNAPKFAGYRGNGVRDEPTARPGTITHALNALLSRDDMERRER